MMTRSKGSPMGIELRNATREDVDGMMPLFGDLYKGDIGPHFADVLQEYVNSDCHTVPLAIADARIAGVLVGSYRLFEAIGLKKRSVTLHQLHIKP